MRELHGKNIQPEKHYTNTGSLYYIRGFLTPIAHKMKIIYIYIFWQLFCMDEH